MVGNRTQQHGITAHLRRPTIRHVAIEDNKQANQTESDQGLASSELEETIPAFELTDEEALDNPKLTDEEADQDDPNDNGGCNECPTTSEPADENELILSPGFDQI